MEDKKDTQKNERKERDSLSLKDTFGRFFEDDFWIEPFDLLRSPRRLMGRMGRDLFPRIDITENDTEVKVVADVPGIDPDDIDIYVEGNRMRITGRSKKESEMKDDYKPYRYERSYGEFRREFALPARVKEDEIKASCKDGVLSVVMPKVEEEKRKRVNIER